MLPLSSLSVRVGRPRRYSRLLSTTRALRSGSFFNLGGLGASREAQYLSREHGIPRAEYSSNIQLIRSSEVDPFAPAPGATPSVAAAATARDNLFVELQAATEELAQSRRALSRLEAKTKGLELAVMLVPVLFSVMAFIGYKAYRDGEEFPADHGRDSVLVSEPHGPTQPYRDATVEERTLTESTWASSETRPKTATGSWKSILAGLFWASN